MCAVLQFVGLPNPGIQPAAGAVGLRKKASCCWWPPPPRLMPNRWADVGEEEQCALHGWF